jgi:hypothetical protein
LIIQSPRVRGLVLFYLMPSLPAGMTRPKRPITVRIHRHMIASLPDQHGHFVRDVTGYACAGRTKREASECWRAATAAGVSLPQYAQMPVSSCFCVPRPWQVDALTSGVASICARG